MHQIIRQRATRSSVVWFILPKKKEEKNERRKTRNKNQKSLLRNHNRMWLRICAKIIAKNRMCVSVSVTWQTPHVLHFTAIECENIFKQNEIEKTKRRRKLYCDSSFIDHKMRINTYNLSSETRSWNDSFSIVWISLSVNCLLRRNRRHQMGATMREWKKEEKK